MADRRETLAQAYDRYADMLFRVAMTYLPSAQDAQDVVQDVFCLYLRRPPLLRDETHQRAWFVRATVHRCIDTLRRNKVRGYTQLEDVEELVEDPTTANEAVSVLHTVQQLPEKLRVAVTLHYLEGYSVEEVATMLRLTPSAVKMRLSRAREQLQQLYQEESHG